MRELPEYNICHSSGEKYPEYRCCMPRELLRESNATVGKCCDRRFANKKDGRTECGKYRGIILIIYVEKGILNVVGVSLGTYSEAEGLLP